MPIKFQVAAATKREEGRRGRMHVESLPDNHGILLLFPTSQRVAMWMKNASIALDSLFIEADRTVVPIKNHTTPLSMV